MARPFTNCSTDVLHHPHAEGRVWCQRVLAFVAFPRNVNFNTLCVLLMGVWFFLISLIIFTRTDNRRHMGNSTAELQCLVPLVLTETPVHSANCWSAFAGVTANVSSVQLGAVHFRKPGDQSSKAFQCT